VPQVIYAVTEPEIPGQFAIRLVWLSCAKSRMMLFAVDKETRKVINNVSVVEITPSPWSPARAKNGELSINTTAKVRFKGTTEASQFRQIGRMKVSER